jgi:hypothetical protein
MHLLVKFAPISLLSITHSTPVATKGDARPVAAMRVLVYAVGVYALMGIGVTEAFAPAKAGAGIDVCIGPGCTSASSKSLPRSPSMRMLHQGVGHQSGVEGGRDGWSGPAMQGQSLYTTAASFEASYVAPAAQNPAEEATSSQAQGGLRRSQSWAPPSGYVPRRESRPAAESGDHVLSQVSSMMASLSTEVPDATRAPAPHARSANTGRDPKGWQTYGGYDPKSRAAPAAATAASAPYQPAQTAKSAGGSSPSSSPEKKWQPYGGYDPKGRAKWQPYGGYDPRHRPASAQGYAPVPADRYEAPAERYEAAGEKPPPAAASKDPLSSAPAKKWQPYGGYDPKSRGRPSQQSAGSSAPAVDGYMVNLSNAPAKKWSPPVGYVPQSAMLRQEQLQEIAKLGVRAPFAAFAASLLKHRLPAALRASQRPSAMKQLVRLGLSFPGKVVKRVLRPFPLRFPRALRRLKLMWGNHAIVGDKGAAPAGAGQDYLNSLSSAPNKKWRAPAGYSPKKEGRGMFMRRSPNRSLSPAPKETVELVKNTIRAAVALPTADAPPAKDNVKDTPPTPRSKNVLQISLSALTKALLAQKAPAALEAARAGASAGDPLSRAPAKKWQPYGGYDPRNRGASSTGGYTPPSAKTGSWDTASKGSVSTDPLSNAPAKKWQPYGGYDPKNRHAPTPVPAAHEPVQAHVPVQARPTETYASAAASNSITSAPAKKWQPYGGYDPKSRAAPSQQSPYQPVESSSSSTAHEQKWQPYGGYDPKDGAGAANPSPSKKGTVTLSWGDKVLAEFDPKAAPPSTAPSATVTLAPSAAGTTAPSAAVTTDPLSSAPAKKWQPYGGYDPKRRGRPSAPAKKGTVTVTWGDHVLAEFGDSDAPANPPARGLSPGRNVQLTWGDKVLAKFGDSGEADGALDRAAAKALKREQARLNEETAKVEEKAAKAEELKAMHANAEHVEGVYTAKYSSEIEAERKERVAFYVGLGVPEDEANRMVARILAAYAEPVGRHPVKA